MNSEEKVANTKNDNNNNNKKSGSCRCKIDRETKKKTNRGRDLKKGLYAPLPRAREGAKRKILY